MVKQCKDCGEVKDINLFSKHSKMTDGYLNSCKACRRLYAKQHRLNHPEKYIEYEKTRSSLTHRKMLNISIGKRYIQKNPKRYKATNKVNNALRDGKLHKLPCFCCGNLKVIAHHVAYDLPLDIVWLCQQHHRELHANIPY